MSQENVEVVTRYFGAITRTIATYWENPRSFAKALQAGDLDADSREVLDHLHPDMRWKNMLGIVYEGKLDCARGVDELMEASQSYSVRADEVTDLGDDHVLVVLRLGMKGQSSGAAATSSVFSVHTLQEGLIAQADEYLSRAEALKAVGLAE
jgi:ketosteroid isomerase-like protein